MTFIYHLYSVILFRHAVVAVTDDGSQVFKITDFYTSLLFVHLVYMLFPYTLFYNA
jgi:hypothetical protein